MTTVLRTASDRVPLEAADGDARRLASVFLDRRNVDDRLVVARWRQLASRLRPHKADGHKRRRAIGGSNR